MLGSDCSDLVDGGWSRDGENPERCQIGFNLPLI